MEHKNLGKYLKELREKANLTQPDVADKVGVKIINVKRWERELEYPELEEMYKLSELYQVSCEDLLNYKKEALSASERFIRGINKFFGVTFITGRTIFYAILIIALIGAFVFFKIQANFAIKHASGPVDVSGYLEEIQ